MFKRISPKTSRKEYLQLWAVHLAGILDGLVFILTLGFIISEVKAYLLFDVFIDDN